jgi:N-acyl-D-aspartate/D-glutamate deacylase
MDLIIRGGTVFDGTGGEPREADIAVTDGKIIRVGRVAGKATEEIDARGKIVTPGFIDVHTHYDGQVIWSKHLSPTSSHGVTTTMIGNCGVGFAPCRKADHDALVNVMEGVEDIPGVVMTEGLTWDWETYPEYLDAIDRRPRDIDVASLLPHSALRLYVMGQRASNREPATADDLQKMYRITREAIAAGAVGIGTSLLFSHRTGKGEQIPTFEAAEAELQAIARGLRDGGGGLYQIVLSNLDGRITDEIAMLDRIAHTTKGNVTFSAGQFPPHANAWRGHLNEVGKFNRQRDAIRAQVFPRGHGIYVSFDLTVHPFCLCPSYMAIAHLPLAEKVKRLRDPAMRAKLLTEETVDNGLPFWAIGRRFEAIYSIGDPPNYEPPPEASLAAQAAKKGVSPLELAYDLLLENDGRAMLFLQFANYVEGSLEFFLDMGSNPNAVLGLGDGGAHYGMVCDSTFPTFFLSYWTRDRKGRRFTTQQAVHKLTAEPARLLGLRDRGFIGEGMKADLNVIDFAKLHLKCPRVAHDLPGGGKRVTQDAAGYDAIVVNGQAIVRNDAYTDALPGRLVRPHRHTSV